MSLVLSVSTSFAENEKEVLIRSLSNLAEIMTNIAVQLESQDQGQVTLNDEITTINDEINKLILDLASQDIAIGNNTITIDENTADITTHKAKINAIISAAGVSLTAIAALPTIP